jgi:hypothetical protein
MSTHTQPNPGIHPHKQVIDSIDQKVNDCLQVIESRILKLTIVVEGVWNTQRLHKYFYFREDSLIPKEIYNFFVAYAQRMAQQAENLLDNNEKTVQLGNDIIQLDDLIKDYAIGLFPSIDAEDCQKLQALAVGSAAVIRINNSIQSIKRIK